MSDVFNLARESQAVQAVAAENSSGRHSKSLLHGERQRVVLIALRAGSELAEHESPPAATLQVVAGECLLTSGEREWTVGIGELVAIPPERHAVTAVIDTTMLLTVTL